MQYHVLASGSKGNATFIYENETGILIDCGITRKQLLYKLKELGFTEKDIDYVFLTHDHYDHSKNIHIFDPRMLYTAKGNVKELDAAHELIPYQTYQFKNISVEVLRISHDATNPIGFIFRGQESLLYLTDTGYVTRRNRDLIHNLNYYIIEANHDIEMLMKTRRPMFLKNRILGDTGHLNNEYSASLMAEVIGADTKEIILAHLSQ
ncbi:MAG: MBL fold metallo-hydrolase, partial [bacterium]